MGTKRWLKILIALLLIFNINISAYSSGHSFTSPDSLVQIQDSSVQKLREISNNTISSTNILTAPNWFYYASDSGIVYCYDYAGNQKWIAEVLGVIKCNPILYKDLLLIATVEGDLYSINSNNGEILQVVGIGESITSDLSLIEISSSKTKIIGVALGTSEGNVFCYDAFTFELLWEKNISKSLIISTPLAVNDKIIFLNSNSSLYCLNSKSGSLIWKYELSNNGNKFPGNFPLWDGKNIFSVTSDGNLIAVDLMLGKRVWSAGTKGILNQIYLNSDNKKLLLIDNKGMMKIYAAQNGKELNKIDFKKSELFSFIVAENQDNTIVGFSDGSLYTFNSKFVFRELLSPNQTEITSINVISNDEFMIKDINGKIMFYKIN